MAIQRPRPLTRVRNGLTRPANWLQLVRFGAVGAVGYVVNLVVFSLCVHGAGLDYRLAAAVAFLVAVTNNFVLNRRWTFAGRESSTAFAAPRFLAVSLASFLLNLGLLQALVAVAAAPAVLAQAVAIGAATPLNFVGNKLWTFGRGERRDERAAEPSLP
jgi:putative flippase GtrA